MKHKVILRNCRTNKFLGKYSLNLEGWHIRVPEVIKLRFLPYILEETNAIPTMDTFGSFLKTYGFEPENPYRIRSSENGNILKFWVEHYDPECDEFVKGEPITLFTKGGVSLNRVDNCYVEGLDMSLQDLALIMGSYYLPDVLHFPHDWVYRFDNVKASSITLSDR